MFYNPVHAETFPGFNMFIADGTVYAEGLQKVPPVWLELATPGSQVQHFTTAPLCSTGSIYKILILVFQV